MQRPAQANVEIHRWPGRRGPVRRSLAGMNLSLRSQTAALVVASVVPLVCMGMVREYLDYRADRSKASSEA